ncbi:MAG: hypothetical protein ACHRHE_25185 [Tepidisphaerales bacterium]
MLNRADLAHTHVSTMWDEQEIELELLERTREPLDVLSVRQKLPIA